MSWRWGRHGEVELTSGSEWLLPSSQTSAALPLPRTPIFGNCAHKCPLRRGWRGIGSVTPRAPVRLLGFGITTPARHPLLEHVSPARPMPPHRDYDLTPWPTNLTGRPASIVTANGLVSHRRCPNIATVPAKLYLELSVTGRVRSAAVFDEDSGVGTQVVTDDVTGDGLPDILVSNKKGTFLFVHELASADVRPPQ